jgi:hypothetical protein
MSNANSKRENANEALRINIQCYLEQTTYIFPVLGNEILFPNFVIWITSKDVAASLNNPYWKQSE